MVQGDDPAAASLLNRINHSSILLLIAFSGLTQVLIIAFYDLFPFKSSLDFIYLRTAGLQSIFAYHLDGDVEYKDNCNAEKLAHQSGLDIKSHTVTTFDGFKLSIHRCRKVEIEEPIRRDSQDLRSYQERRNRCCPVLIMHGLLQDSESFLCGEHNLASVLVRAGFDVWLANNRGNKYSAHHVKYSDRENKYWDFSLDDLVQKDTPAFIDYIINTTGFQKVSIIGFSQGSAQVFGCLSHQPQMCGKVDIFVALAPPVYPIGSKDKSSSSSSSLMKVAQNLPFFITMLFGWKAMLPVVPRCQRICSKRFFASMAATAMDHLFGWKGRKISSDRKRELFQHVYSPSSVKIVVHWFQMILTGQLCQYKQFKFTWWPSPSSSSYFCGKMQLFGSACRLFNRPTRSTTGTTKSNNVEDPITSSSVNDNNLTNTHTHHAATSADHYYYNNNYDDSSSSSNNSGNSSYGNAPSERVNYYDLSTITCPVAVIAGAEDRIINPSPIETAVQRCVKMHIEPEYEHLDLIWADDVHEKIFPVVIDLLDGRHN